MIYIVDESVYFLDHAGVKGMRWGVRKEEKEVRRENKAKKYDDKAANFQKKIDDLNKITPKSYYHKTQIRQKKMELTDKKKQAELDATAKREGKLTDKQRKIAKGAAVAGGILAAYGAYHIVETGELNRQVMRGRDFLSGNKGHSWAQNSALSNPNLDADGIMNTVVKGINPEYGAFGTKMNCRRCTFAYEMRRRGNEVAATKSMKGRGQDVSGLLNATRPGEDRVKAGFLGLVTEYATEKVSSKVGRGKSTPVTDALVSGNPFGKKNIEGAAFSAGAIFDALKGEPNGSRGELGVTWGIGGGHSMAYEIVKGKPVIFDNQSGKMFKNGSDLNKAFGGIGGVATAAYTRLDNLDLNSDFLMRWLKDA